MSYNNIFPFNVKSLHNVAMRSEHLDDSQLWYLRYGHLNYNGFQLLKKKNLVLGCLQSRTKLGFVKDECMGKCIVFPFQRLSGKQSTT
jgi:hypothetical protein